MVTRIRELLEARQLSPTQFADLIGVGRPVVSHILSERNKPSLEVVQRIVDAFPDVSLSWLMKGIGSMLADAAPASAVAPAIPASVAPRPPVTSGPPSQPTPTIAPGSTPHPQAFSPSATGVAQPPSIASPVLRPIPPKFRPARAITSPAAAPTPVPTAVEPATEELITAPPISQAPVAAFATVPPPTPQPALAAPGGYGSLGLGPNYPQAVFAPAPTEAEHLAIPAFAPEGQQAAPALQPAPLVASQVVAPAPPAPAVADMPLAAVPSAPAAEVATTPNPAAALSFLGEPGKAIRRIVIFYRDGSFSDYVPEGY